MKKVSIDTGYGYGLMKSAEKEINIPSFVTEINGRQAKEYARRIKESDIATGKSLIVKFEEKYYIVGELAITLKKAKRRYSTGSERIKDVRHLVQVATLLGLAYKDNNEDVCLGFALPTVLLQLENEMIETLKRKYTVSYLYDGGENTKTINVKEVYHIAQSVAPVYNLDIDDILETRIISIDLGHNTNDYCFFESTFVAENYHGKGAYNNLYKRIAEEIRNHEEFSQFDNQVSEMTQQQAIEKGFINNKDVEVDVKPLRTMIFKEYCQTIVEDVITNFEELLNDTQKFLVSGGVMEDSEFKELLTNEFKKHNIKIATTDKPQYAIVRGIYKYLEFLGV